MPPPPPPEPPVQVGAIPAQIVNTGESTVIDVASYFRDPDGASLSYTAATSAPSVVSVSISGSSLTMFGVADGQATVTVTATDSDGLTATQSVNVTVQTPNRAPAPSGAIPAQTVNAGETVTLDVASYFSDPDGDALGYGATTSAPGVVSVSTSGSSLIMVGVAEGTATVTVTATDPGGLTATQGVGVTVQRPNRAPTPSGSIPAQTLNPGRTETLDVASYFSDPDSDRLTYGATTSNAAVVSVRDSGSRVTFTGVAEGTATVTVTATDPGGLFATQSVSVTVQASNRAPMPVGSVAPQRLEAGRTARLEMAGYFNDPDGDFLRYSAVSSAAGVVSPSMSRSTLTLVGVAGGTATVTVTATDPDGLTGTQTIQVSVTGRSGGFREDFETSANLGDWEIQNADAAVWSSVPAADSVLALTNRVTDNLGSAERRSPPSLRAWELSAEISRATGEATPGVIWFTTHSRFLAVRLLLPMPATATDMNYEFAVFDGAQNSWLTVTNLSGNSRAISAAPNAYDHIRLAHETEAGFFVFEVGANTPLFRISLDVTLAGVRLGDILDGLVDIWLVNRADINLTARFDWVEVSGEEISADAASGVDAEHVADRVRALAGAPAANQVRLGRRAGGRD